jgi:coproporphyrinogen III oxidase
MSLPSDVSWRYKFDESLTESERNLYTVIKKPKDWINDT